MPELPNVLLFLTDDHGAWATGCYGNAEVRSPRIDGLAEDGVRFDRAFTPSPVCSPARASLLTGRTPSQVGIHDWLQEAEPEIADRDWLDGEATLPELLSEAGYHCALAGKWHLGRSHEVPRGFDRCFGLPGGQGTHDGEYTYHLDGDPVTLTGNKTRIITDHALRFLDEAPADRPFFLTVGYIATHSPWAGQDPELVALYDDATWADVWRPGRHPWAKDEGFASGEASAAERTEAADRERWANYYAAVTDIDRGVGRVVDRLAALGRLDDTLVIYTSDHGLTLGQHGFWGKGNSTRPLSMYDTSLRVPLLVRPPHAPEGRRVDACVDHYDTFATICDYAGIVPDPGRACPGRTFRPAIEGRADEAWDDTRYGEYGDLRMIRTPRWKLVCRYGHGPDELFDLVADPREEHDVIGRAGNAAVVADLRRRLDAFYAVHRRPEADGLRVASLPRHNGAEAWRDGIRETRFPQAAQPLG
ncbi:sulfatase [Isoptericola sp. BMS4]|uniref:sulfatase family protein n=1 Tax=Isoptericola sp. BMS4 TaxID=2527875 RepID=UPI001420A391|nr:sulfatase-like hydrolase/transferase [Isoptericola sp. BMS4]